KLFVTGYSKGSTTGHDWATLAYDAGTGALVWKKRYNGPGNATDAASALALSPDGTKVFVTGYSFATATLNDFTTIAYDAGTGRVAWKTRSDGPASYYDSANALV